MREAIDPFLDLCGTWRFQPDPCSEGEALGYERADYDDAEWREVIVPCAFDSCGPGLAGYEGAGWFRRRVSLPRTWGGRHIALHCAGINYRSRIWLNGVEIGGSEDGFLPVELPLGKAARPGEPNVLVICADNRRRAGDVPGLQRGWRPYGGVLRPLHLAAADPLRIEDATVIAEPHLEGGRLRITMRIANSRASYERPAVMCTILDAEGAECCRLDSSAEVPAGASAVVELEADVPGAVPWSPRRPALYTARIELYSGGSAVDLRDVRFGFRRVEVRDGLLWLNGGYLTLTGFNRHEDSPRTGMTPDPETTRRDLEEMRKLDANFVRLCHYPHDSLELDLCDELGLLAMGEIPLYWWDGLGEGDAACTQKLESARRQLRRMIERDRNHPSLIFWSVSNETQEQQPEVAAGNAELVRLAKQLDPTRLVTHVSDKWPHDPHFEADDIACVNAYPTWGARCCNPGPAYDPAESARWWRENLARLHGLYPDKPILVSEFGYPALPGVTGNAIGEDVQAAAITAEMAAFADPAVCGITVWCWADHPWPEEDFINRVTTSPFGVVTRDRQPKRVYAALQQAWSSRQSTPCLLLRRKDLLDLPELPPLPPGCRLQEWDRERPDPLAALMRRAFFPDEWSGQTVMDTLVGDETVKKTFVVECGGSFVSCASVRIVPEAHPGSGYVHWVASDPARRGERLGFIATLAVLHELARMGCQDSVLETQEFRLPALRLYRKLGFERVMRCDVDPARWNWIDERLRD